MHRALYWPRRPCRFVDNRDFSAGQLGTSLVGNSLPVTKLTVQRAGPSRGKDLSRLKAPRPLRGIGAYTTHSTPLAAALGTAAAAASLRTAHLDLLSGRNAPTPQWPLRALHQVVNFHRFGT